MKKMKKLAALVLAMVMAFSLMAVTAAAYGADEHEHDATCCEATIQPRGLAMSCDYCGRGMTLLGQSGSGDGNFRSTFACYNADCSNYGKRVVVEWHT